VSALFVYCNDVQHIAYADNNQGFMELTQGPYVAWVPHTFGRIWPSLISHTGSTVEYWKAETTCQPTNSDCEVCVTVDDLSINHTATLITRWMRW